MVHGFTFCYTVIIMKIFGISSATKIVSIGLIDEDKVLVETTVSDMRAERILLYAKEAGIEAKQIEGVAVAVGPGSYSGLRGGLATAKTLAQTLNIPLVGIPTLEAIAYNLIDKFPHQNFWCGNKEGTIAVILDAKRDEYNFALFSASGGVLKRLTDDLVMKMDQIEEKLAAISGEVHLAKGSNAHPYGINVAKLGLLKIKAKEISDPLKLIPQYSHTPNIREYK